MRVRLFGKAIGLFLFWNAKQIKFRSNAFRLSYHVLQVRQNKCKDGVLCAYCPVHMNIARSRHLNAYRLHKMAFFSAVKFHMCSYYLYVYSPEPAHISWWSCTFFYINILSVCICCTSQRLCVSRQGGGGGGCMRDVCSMPVQRLPSNTCAPYIVYIIYKVNGWFNIKKNTHTHAHTPIYSHMHQPLTYLHKMHVYILYKQSSVQEGLFL